MRKTYIQPDAEILKLSSLIDDFLTTSAEDVETEEPTKPDNGMSDSDADIANKIPSFW